ncbi:MAG: phage tail tape measure protein [Aliifodinibius sp.]|nr:phage tail tape measure protein [candidate division Zixibacteria bacterium]NIT58977.1 phage tail tape measure protein [Fodinibius sp.]NIX01215.1 phage tail tape measure protein [Phycisphaerae bacterium]NIR65532.1 phage tail tape measure protein [candidate division Zixibacteria bacterium]NIS47217.1 phage tail tape measure protein [candidate division Zixibacteria bacterium]
MAENVVELLVKVVSDGKQVLERIGKSVRKFEKDTKESARSTKKMGDSSKKTSKDVEALGKSADKTGKQVGKASKSVKKYNAEVAKTGKASKDATKSLNSMGSAGGSLLTTFTALTGTLLTFGFPLVKAAQFERSMSEVQAISGATGEELERLTLRAREMGSTTEYSATQAASGLKYLAMAGLDVNEAIEALPGVLNLAQAGAMDLGRAADIATNILSGFGLPVSELARVNDVLVQTFTNTNSTLEELGYAMSYVAPIAAGLGAEFEEVTAALGLLHNAGMKGSMAGTTLRGIMSRLVSPTKKAAAVLDKLGKRLGDTAIQIRNSEGNWIGFGNLLKQFEDSGLTAAEAMELLGQRAGPGLAALLAAGSDAMERMTQLNRDAEGRATTIAKVMHQNVVGSFKAFQSIVEDTAIELGNHLLPILDAFLKKASEVTRAVRDWAQENPRVAKSLLEIGLGGAAVLTFLISMSAVITGIMAVSGPLIGAIKGLITGFTALGTAVSGSILGVTGLSAALTGLIGVLTALGGALAIAVGAFTFSETFRNWILEFELFGQSIRDWLDTFKSYFIIIFAEVDEAVGGSLSALISLIGSVFGLVGPIISTAINGIKIALTLLFKLVKQVQDYFRGVFFTSIRTVFSGIANFIKERIGIVQLVIGELMDYTSKKLIEFVGFLRTIPGLGKLLDTESVDEVVKSLERVNKAGKALKQMAVGSAGAINEEMQALKQTAEETLENLKRQREARKKYDALKEREVTLQNNIDRAIKKVIATRAVEEKRLKAALNTAKSSLKEQSNLYVNLAEVADESLTALTDTIEERTSDIWANVTSDKVAADFADVLAGINRDFDLSEQERMAKTQSVEAQMSQARVDAVSKGLGEISKLYDTELEAFTKLERAKHIVAGQTEQQRQEAEERVSKDIARYAQEVYQEKVKYATKAQAELNKILTASLKREEEITNSILDLQDKVADSRKTAEEKVKELRRSGMSEYNRYVDEVAEVEQLLQTAAATMSVDAEKSIELYNRAINAASGLGKEVKDGERVVVEQATAVNRAITLIETAEAGIVKAGVAGQQVLQGNLEKQKSTTESVTDAISTIQSQIDKLSKQVSEAMKVDVQVDEEAFTESIAKLEEQAEIKLNAEMNFNLASQQLADWQLGTADMVEAVKIPLQLEMERELTESLEDLDVLQLLKEEVQVKVTKGEELDATLMSLLQVSGIAKELTEEFTIQVDDDGTINAAQQQVLDLADELDDLPEEKVVKIKVEVDSEGATVAGTPIVEARSTGGLAGSGFNRLSSPHITSGSGLKDDVPALLKKNEYVHRPEAVKAYGLPFMEWVNNLRIPVEAVRNLMSQGADYIRPLMFNDGGLALPMRDLNALQPSVPEQSFTNTTNISNTKYYVTIGKDGVPPRGDVQSKAKALIDAVRRNY